MDCLVKNLFSSINWCCLNVLPFIVVMFILVFVHEMGHFLYGRRYGVKIDVFALGMGPEMCGFTDKKGVRWRLCYLPIGGYVQYAYDDNIASTPSKEALANLPQDCLLAKTPFQRIMISLGGPLFNYILGFAVLFALYDFAGYRYVDLVVDGVAPNTLAHSVGIKPGDRIVALNNNKLVDVRSLRMTLDMNAYADRFTLDIYRDNNYEHDHKNAIAKPQGNTQNTVELLPEEELYRQENLQKKGNFSLSIPAESFKKYNMRLGADFNTFSYREMRTEEALMASLKDCFLFSWMSLKGVVNFFLKPVGNTEVGGTLAIMSMSSSVAKTLDYREFLWFLAILSINLGFFNLLPIPLVDGGAVVLTLIEAIKGDYLSEKTYTWVVRVGVSIIGFFFIFSTWADIKKLKLLEGLFG